MEEVRPAGFGRWTMDLPVRSIGGTVYSSPAPFEFVNAEWGSVEVDGGRRDRSPGAELAVQRNQRIRMELLNTGPASWTASQQGAVGSVWVAVEPPKGDRRLLAIPAARFGDRLWVSWTAGDAGTYRIRPFLFGSGPFGEPLAVNVAEPAR